MPHDLNLESVKDYIDNLPIIDDPEMFGLHNNANINFYEAKAK